MDAWAQQDVRARDVVAWPTNLGWMMGPWLLYSALLNGAAVALFQVVGAPKSFLQCLQTLWLCLALPQLLCLAIGSWCRKRKSCWGYHGKQRPVFNTSMPTGCAWRNHYCCVSAVALIH